jgi:hypothetical protein
MPSAASRMVRRLIVEAGAIFGSPPAGAARAGAAPAPDGVDAQADHRDDVVLSLGRVELELLGSALLEIIEGVERPASPALLESALIFAIAQRSGHGTPSVSRQPAGLHTPETWQVRIERADDGTRDALMHATSGGAFA